MILDNIRFIERYRGLKKEIFSALEFLKRNEDNPELEDGKYAIAGDEFTALVIRANTVHPEESKMEIHRKFMDIHFLLDGEEFFGYSSDFQSDSGYEPKKDIDFGSGSEEVFYRVQKGDFYIVWPEEAHRPLAQIKGNPAEVRKIICKIRIDGTKNESS